MRFVDTFKVDTQELKRMYEYSGLNFNELLSLPYSKFMLIRKDSFYHDLKQSEQGVEVLDALGKINITYGEEINDFKEFEKIAR